MRMPDPMARYDEASADVLRGRVIGAFYEVYNVLGYGHLEAVYANALGFELTRRGIAFEREVQLVVRYNGLVVGIYRADYVVERALVLELKATVLLSAADRAQLLNCLKGASLAHGLLLHFGPEPIVRHVVAR